MEWIMVSFTKCGWIQLMVSEKLWINGNVLCYIIVF